MWNKNKKKTSFTFLPYECAAAEEYLELMAEKGWLLQDIKGNSFEFKKIEPKKIKYLVDVIHKVSIFDNKNSDKAIEYREYRQSEGWKYLCEKSKIQIFYSLEEKKGISFPTDEEEKFKAVIKASLYYGGGKFLLGLIVIFNLYMQLGSGDVGFTLSSDFALFSVMIMVSILLISSIEVIRFSIWVIKARVHLKQDEIMFYKKYKQIRIKGVLIKSYFVIIILIFLKSYIFNSFNIKEFDYSLLIIMFIPLIILFCVFKLIYRKRNLKKINMVITVSGVLISGYLVLMGVSFGLINSPIISQNEVTSEKFDLTLMDFGLKETNSESPYSSFDKSIIAQRVDYSSGNDDYYLSYTILQSDYKLIIKFYENRLLNRLNGYVIDLKQENTNLPSNIVVYLDSEKRTFVLVSEDKVVEIRKDFADITQEEFLNTVYKKLFY